MTTHSTVEDVVKAAVGIARDAAEGRLDPADLQRQAVAELTDLVGTVAGPDDPLWDLQCQIARGVLAAGGIEPNQLAEWAAVGRRRENPDAADTSTAVAPTGVLEPPETPDVPTEADTAALEPYSGENDAEVADTEPEPVSPAVDLVPVDRHVLAVGRGLPVDNGLRPL